MMNRKNDDIREIQKRMADQAQSVSTLFSQIDGLLQDMLPSGDPERIPVDKADSYILRLRHHLTLLKEAKEELYQAERQLKTRLEEDGEKEAVRLSVIQAEQLLLAIDREMAVLDKSLNDLRTLQQAQKQSEDVAAVTTVKHFQDALRRYSDEQEKNR